MVTQGLSVGQGATDPIAGNNDIEMVLMKVAFMRGVPSLKVYSHLQLQMVMLLFLHSQTCLLRPLAEVRSPYPAIVNCPESINPSL